MKYFFTQDKNGEKKLLSTRRITNKGVVTVRITNQGGDIEKLLSLSGKDCSGHISIWDLPGITFGDPNEEAFFTINFYRFIMTLSETTDEYIKYRVEFYSADVSDTTPVYILTSLTCYHHDSGDTCDLLRDDEEIVATTLGGVPGIFVKISDDVEAITVAAGERINGLLSYSGLCVNGVYGHGQPFDKIVIEFLETNGNTYNKYRLTMTMGNVVVASIDVINYERNAGGSDLPTSIEISGSSYEAAVFNLFNPEEPFVSSVRTKMGGKTYALGAVGDAVMMMATNREIANVYKFKNEIWEVTSSNITGYGVSDVYLNSVDGCFFAMANYWGDGRQIAPDVYEIFSYNLIMWSIGFKEQKDSPRLQKLLNFQNKYFEKFCNFANKFHFVYDKKWTVNTLKKIICIDDIYIFYATYDNIDYAHAFDDKNGTNFDCLTEDRVFFVPTTNCIYAVCQNTYGLYGVVGPTKIITYKILKNLFQAHPFIDNAWQRIDVRDYSDYIIIAPTRFNVWD